MDAAFWTAIAALSTSLTASPLMVIVTTRERRAETRETWRRQDDVAARLKVTDAAAVATAAHTTALIADNQSRLRQIHILVNSALSSALRREYDASAALLASMAEVVSLRRAAGEEPSVATEDMMLELELRLSRLAAQLVTISTATTTADAGRAADLDTAP